MKAAAEQSAGIAVYLDRFDPHARVEQRPKVTEFPEEVVRSFSESMGLYDKTLITTHLFTL